MPYSYYYRRLEKERSGRPAKSYSLDIDSYDSDRGEGVHLLPVIWNRRLYLFWKVATPKATPKGEAYDQLRLAWSEYRGGKWSPKQMVPGQPELILDPSCRMDVEQVGDKLTIVFASPAVKGIGEERGYQPNAATNGGPSPASGIPACLTASPASRS